MANPRPTELSQEAREAGRVKALEMKRRGVTSPEQMGRVYDRLLYELARLGRKQAKAGEWDLPPDFLSTFQRRLKDLGQVQAPKKEDAGEDDAQMLKALEEADLPSRPPEPGV